MIEISKLRRGLKLLLTCGFCVALVACQLGKVASDVGKQELQVSFLTINLRSIYDTPCNGPRAQWRERYSRIGKWIKNSGNTPDIIALQEAPGWWWCPTNARLLPDYAALDFLVDSIRTNVGVTYRVAYLVGAEQAGGEGGCGVDGGTSTGGCHLWQGLALLYNPARLKNVYSSRNDLAVPHDNTSSVGVHLRRSLPCCDPAQDRRDIQDRIDGPPQMDKCGRATPSGLAWTVATNSPLGWVRGPAFTAFEHVHAPGKTLNVYNLHFRLNQVNAVSVDAAKILISEMEQRFPNRLYPPVLLGDFNLGEADALSALPDFQVGFYTPTDVIGVLTGRPSIFQAQYGAAASWSGLMLPEGASQCPGDVNTLWTDHCSVFAKVLPY